MNRKPTEEEKMRSDLILLKSIQKKSIQVILNNCKWNIDGCKFKGSPVEKCSALAVKLCPILAPVRDAE
jgi:hypothetical protein